MFAMGQIQGVIATVDDELGIEYDGNKVVRVHTILISTQHGEEVDNETIRRDLIEHVIKAVIPAELLDEETIIYINPTGRFVIGGPQGDTGLTGRKIIIDTYGGYSRHGGGAFSGKDPTKVDRSAAYAARYVAKNIVAAGLADKCEIELAYLCLDEVKSISDDSTFNENHIILLADKYRAFLIKQRYSDVKKHIPESNYQTICLDLTKSVSPSGPCGRTYLMSKEEVPNILSVSNTRVYPIDFYQDSITFISRDRMRYVGYDKYLQNIIYCSLAPDNHLYLISMNPQFLYLSKIKVTAIFEDASIASELECGDNKECDVLDRKFPIEESLVTPLVSLIVGEVLGAKYRPDDNKNNAKDDSSDVSVKQ